MELQNDYLGHAVDTLKFPHLKKAVEFFNYFSKAVKAKLVYPASSKLPNQFKTELAAKAKELLDDVECLEYKISSNSIQYGDAAVYESNSRAENFAHVFFRDGVTNITFHKGIDEGEMNRFVDLLARMLRTVYIDDDLATLLWEENFENISYKLIDDGLEIETVEYSVDNFKPKKNIGEDEIRSLFQDEAEITFDEDDFATDQQQDGLRGHGAAFAGMPDRAHDFLNSITEFSQDEKNQIAEILGEDAKFDHIEYLLIVIFEILGMEREVPGYVETLGFIGKVRDNFISLGNFEGAAELLKRMHEMLDVLRNLKSPRAEKIESFLLDCSSKDKIEYATETINGLSDFDARALFDYLKQLPWAAIDPLLASLGELKSYKARESVCAVLAELGKEQLDLIARGLDDDRWYVVRNVVMVLGQIGTPNIVNYLKKTIRHQDYRVRKETVSAAARINTPESADFMILALSDADAKIQMSSLDYLIEKNCTRAFRAVENVVKDKKFKDRPPEQVKKFIEGYSLLGQDKALPHLKQLASRRLLFGSSREERLKLLAIGALSDIKLNDAARLLSKLAQNKNKKVSAAAMKAINRLQRAE